MPLYDYQCSSCTNSFEKRLSISEYEAPITEPCPSCSVVGTVSQVLTSAAICDPVRLGIIKPPSDFQKYVLGRIKNSVPGNNIGQGKFGPLARDY